MLRDITIGQFFPGNSVIHKIDPRVKILLVITDVIALFLISNIFTLILFMLATLFLYKFSKISLRLILRSVKPLLFIVIFTSVINIFFTEGNVIFELGILKISKEGICLSLMLILRILNMVMFSSLLTYTTSPIELTYALEKLMKPLEFLKVPVSDISMMMTISLRFVPTLIQETDKIILAQKSRGAKLDTGNIVQKIKSFIPVIIPLFVSAFRAADDLAISMECRCYNSGKGKTSMRQLKIQKSDVLILCVSLIFLAFIFCLDWFLKMNF